MLMLTRKRDEKIIIILPSGDTIEVMVSEIDRTQVRIGIVAAPHIKIYREELISLARMVAR